MTKTERQKTFKKYNKRLYDLKKKNVTAYDYLLDKISKIEGINLTSSGYISTESELDDLALRAINSIVETSKEAIKSYIYSQSYLYKMKQLAKEYKSKLDDFYPDDWDDFTSIEKTVYRKKRSTNTQKFLSNYGKALYKSRFDKAQELLNEYYYDL